MKYYTISISGSGHGAIFTNALEARKYQSQHPGSVSHVFDKLPEKIPPVATKPEQRSKIPKAPRASGKITVYTDGSALGNPGPGGYGVVIKINGETFEYSQGYRHTTNNRMEMMAVITALVKLKDYRTAPITIHSDSQYTINGITKGWARGWRRKGWKKSDGKPALNPDLWSAMLDLVDQVPQLSFKWVKGHAGDPLNERADDLANSAAGQGVNLMIDEGYVK